MKKDCSFATFVRIVFARKPIFSINYRNSALNIVIMVVQITFEQNYENTTAKKARSKDKGGILV